MRLARSVVQFRVRPGERDRIPGGHSVRLRELETVVLTRDMPEAGPCAGDLGAVVQVYAPDSVEVEFVTASGRTVTLQTLTTKDVRRVRDDDLLAVRPAVPGAA